jgi:hypothetical protein
MRRARPVLALISGLMWGLGAAVLINLYGVTSLSPAVLYGFTGGAALLSLVWSLRGRRRRSREWGFPVLAIAVLVPTVILAQEGECEVGFEPSGRILSQTSPEDPLRIDPEDGEPITVHVWTAEGVDGADAVIWVEIGGIEIPLRSGQIIGDVFRHTFQPRELLDSLGGLPGLHHVGGTIEGVCEVDGYVRVLGNPLTTPVGIAAAVLVVLGLAGAWFAAGAAEPSAPAPTHGAEPPDAVEAEPPEAAPLAPVGTRWLQARLFADAPDRTLLDHFLAGVRHEIEVRIGPREQGWLTGTTPFPDDRLPARGPHLLSVVLTEPHLLGAPQVRALTLPEQGSSTSAWFELTTRADTARVEARLTVLYGNRVLHTARLPDRVGAESHRDGRGADDVAEVETVIQGTGGLGKARGFDAAFVVNHDHHGVGRVTGIAGDNGRDVDLTEDEVADAIDLVTNRLKEIVEQPDDFAGLDAAGTVELLAYLARHGSMLRDALVGEFLDTLGSASRLQVVSARQDAYFPFEFAYDFASPTEQPVGVCPTGRELLGSREVGATCPGPHGRSIVCPLGFWGLSKTIERRTFHEPSRLNPRFFISAQPREGRDRITLGAGSMFAASDLVDGFSAGSIARVAGAMAAAAAGHSLRADTWQQWTADVKARRPSLLMLLPHSVADDDRIPNLEIGDHDRRPADLIDEECVSPEDQPVMVVLLGCETALTGPVDYERFPRRFRHAGAEIVVGTLTEVLGRHAAPIAERMVTVLHEETTRGASSLGEVIVVLRRRLLAEGLPAILAVAAFGDADWLIDS